MRLKRTLTSSVANIYSLCKGERIEQGFRVLLYHSVNPRSRLDSYGFVITPELFERQMRILAKSDWLRVTCFKGFQTDGNSGGLKVAVTFDDGFKDNLYIAAPILLKYRIPFTVFVISSFIKDGREDYLTPSELRELAALPGVTIGSHTATHIRLAGADEKTLRRELWDSRHEIEDIIGREADVIAYPHGSVTLRARDAALEAGYELGGCSRFGINDAKSHPLLLSRCEVWASDTASIFRQKLTGAWDWYRWRARITC